MEFSRVNAKKDLSDIVQILNESHATIASDFKFTKETNPTNNAFMDEDTLRSQLGKGIDLFLLTLQDKPIGCVAIEKSTKEAGTYYIEKLSVLPAFRHEGFGLQLMEYATTKIKANRAKKIGIALIDANLILKQWYAKQGFVETGTKDFEHLPFRVCFMSKTI
jgi:diamine N-acetyltransferase